MGFRTDSGPDDAGFAFRFYEGGAYYLDIGCSQLVIDGEVKLLPFADIDTFDPSGAVLRNGTAVPVDLIVLATGYQNMQSLVRRIFGDGVADRVGPVWGFDDDGEIRNTWKRTPQEGLWFMAGGFSHCRTFSRFLALQLKACEEGLLPAVLA